jgi:hypothetical protein
MLGESRDNRLIFTLAWRMSLRANSHSSYRSPYIDNGLPLQGVSANER